MTVAMTGEERGQLEKLARRGTASLVGAAFSSLSGILLVVIVTNGFSRDVAGTLSRATRSPGDRPRTTVSSGEGS